MGTSHGAFIHPRTFSSLELAGPHRTAASQPARKRGSAFREGTPRAAQRQRHHFFFQRSQRHRLLFWQSALVSPRRRCARSRLNKHASATEHSPIGAGVGFLAPVRLDPSATTTTNGGGGGGRIREERVAISFPLLHARGTQYRHAPMESPRTSPMRALAKEATRGGGDAKTPYVRQRTRAPN